MEKKWKKFERVVAAIHLAEAKGADVRWNHDINGRQFDVVIRFKFQFYEYLVIVECKDHGRPVEAKEIDAFVTKSADAHANKAVVVSSQGFQTGAVDVAKKHHIELFTLTEVQAMPEDILTDQIVPVLMVCPIGFQKTNSEEKFFFSLDQNRLAFEVDNIKLKGYGFQPLAKIIRPLAHLLAPFEIPGVPKFGASFPVATAQRQNIVVQLATGTIAVIPVSDEEIPVSHLLISYWMDSVRLMKPTSVDPTIYTEFGKRYDYTNELTKESVSISADTVPLGVDTILQPGRFYKNPSIKFAYFCKAVTDRSARIVLVESYQHGDLIQGEFEFLLGFAESLVEVTDSAEIDRLTKMYEELMDVRTKAKREPYEIEGMPGVWKVVMKKWYGEDVGWQIVAHEFEGLTYEEAVRKCNEPIE